MSNKASKQVNFSPDGNEKPKILLKHELGRKSASRTRSGNRKRVVGILCFRLPKCSKFSSSRLLRRLGAKVAWTLRFVSIERRSSRKVSSSSILARSRSLADSSSDSHRAEAIEDCIEFLNSSSSLQRSNSVSINS